MNLKINLVLFVSLLIVVNINAYRYNSGERNLRSKLDSELDDIESESPAHFVNDDDDDDDGPYDKNDDDDDDDDEDDDDTTVSNNDKDDEENDAAIDELLKNLDDDDEDDDEKTINMDEDKELTSDDLKELLDVIEELIRNDDETSENDNNDATSADNIDTNANNEHEEEEDDEDDDDDKRVFRLKKRFLGSLFGNKKKTTTLPPYIYPEETTTTTKRYISPVTPSTTTSKYVFFSASSSSSRPAVNPTNVESDPFYLLKKKCAADKYDPLCSQRKDEMYNLVKRCDALALRNNGQVVPACKEILSIYCYVFSNQDLSTCMLKPHDPYIPGQSTTTASATRSSTYKPVATSSSTYKPVTTSSSTFRPITTSSTTRSVITAKPTQKPGVLPYPFDLIPGFTGTLTTLPEDEKIMKEIGNFCVKPGVKDKNCDKMLLLLKERFKTCQNVAASDAPCQSFKKKFCNAYPQFPNCKVVKPKRKRLFDVLRSLALEDDRKK